MTADPVRINALFSISKEKKKKKIRPVGVYSEKQTRVTVNEHIFKSGLTAKLLLKKIILPVITWNKKHKPKWLL